MVNDINKPLENRMGQVVKGAGPNSITHVIDKRHDVSGFTFMGAASDEIVSAAKENGAVAVVGYEVESKYQHPETGHIDYKALRESNDYPDELIGAIEKTEKAGAVVVLKDTADLSPKAELGHKVYRVARADAGIDSGVQEDALVDEREEVKSLTPDQKQEATQAFHAERGAANQHWAAMMDNGVSRARKDNPGQAVQVVDMSGGLHMSNLGGSVPYDKQLSDRLYDNHKIDGATYTSVSDHTGNDFTGAQQGYGRRNEANGRTASVEQTNFSIPQEYSTPDANTRPVIKVVPDSQRAAPEVQAVSTQNPASDNAPTTHENARAASGVKPATPVVTGHSNQRQPVGKVLPDGSVIKSGQISAPQPEQSQAATEQSAVKPAAQAAPAQTSSQANVAPAAVTQTPAQQGPVASVSQAQPAPQAVAPSGNNASSQATVVQPAVKPATPQAGALRNGERVHNAHREVIHIQNVSPEPDANTAQPEQQSAQASEATPAAGTPANPQRHSVRATPREGALRNGERVNNTQRQPIQITGVSQQQPSANAPAKPAASPQANDTVSAQEEDRGQGNFRNNETPQATTPAPPVAESLKGMSADVLAAARQAGSTFMSNTRGSQDMSQHSTNPEAAVAQVGGAPNARASQGQQTQNQANPSGQAPRPSGGGRFV